MSRRTLVLLLLLLFATRALLVLANADVFFYGDELAKGTAAKGLLEGVGAPRWKLDYVYHEGGGFLITHANALAYAVVGESVLAHKLVAILTTSLLLAVGVWMTSEHFGRKAAAMFGLLFVFCPTSFLLYSLLSIGTHFEAVLFAALVLHFGMRIASAERGRASDWMLLGVSAGLGLYFSLQTAPAIAIAGVWLLARLRSRLEIRSIAVAAVGFALGALPLWIMMSHVGTRALVVQAHTNFDSGLRGWAAIREWLHPLVREPDFGAWILAIGFPIVAVAGLRAASAAERVRLAPVLLYLALFVALYAGSGFAIGNEQVGRLFWLRSSSLWFFGILVLSVCAAQVPRVGAAVVGLLVVSGIASLVTMVRAGRPGAFGENWTLVATTKGYDLTDYFDKYAEHFDGSPADRLPRLRAFRDDPDLLLPAATHSLLEHAGLSLPEALGFVRAQFGDDWAIAARGLGLEIAPDYGHDLAEAFAAIETQPADAQAPLAEALGRVAFGLKITPAKIDGAARATAPANLRDAFLRGVGWRIHRMHRLRPDLAAESIERQPADTRAALGDGYERARAANTLK